MFQNSGEGDFHEKENTAYSLYLSRVKALLQEKYKDFQPLALVHTYGCQQNVSDGEKIKGMLALMGYGFCENAEDAELIIYNTCAVRENAEDRVFGNVGQLKQKKRQNPNLLIALCGCMTQQEHIVEKIKKSYPYVDLIFGTHVLKELPRMLYEALTQKKRVVNISQENEEIPEGLPVIRSEKYQAYLPIMYGCNNFCTYCIVPYVRGRERSRSSAEIKKEFTELLRQGYRDITLLGQNVNSYGKGLEEEINFSSLLRLLNGIEGEFRLRFMTSHPRDASFELIDTIAECEKVCPHFHLPVQSGSDRILKEMNRHYTREDYLRLIDYAKMKIPEISFTSDIIVGFPGETEEDFQQTLSLIKEVEYDSLFSFIYSKRVGTRAAEMPDETSPEEKSDRFQRLLALQREIGSKKLSAYVGRVCRVLVDSRDKYEMGYLSGRTENFIIVNFPFTDGAEKKIGQFVNIKITKALNWALIGEEL